MTHSLKIAAAAIVLFAAAASLPAQSTWPVEHSSNLDSTRVNAPPPSSRSWFLLPLGFYILPVVILAVILLFKNRRNKMMHDTLRAMIEKGMPITPELIASLKPGPNPRGQQMCYLLPGLICSAVGIAVMVNGGRAGLIPLLIGVAFLIAWQVEKRTTKPDQPPGQ